MNKRQLERLKDALEDVGDLAEVLENLMEENERLKEKVDWLKLENEEQAEIIREYGIDPRENRLWFISAVQDFVRSLGV